MQDVDAADASVISTRASTEPASARARAMAWPSASVAGRPMPALPKPVRLILSCGALHVANSIAHAPRPSRHSWSMLAAAGVELVSRAAREDRLELLHLLEQLRRQVIEPLDAAQHREWIFRLGRLHAEGRIAHLICELIERLRLIGQYDGQSLPIPLLQRDYAEACGITPVHANRSFKNLKERGILKPHGDGKIEILDETQLRSLGEFDGSYLYGEGALALDGLTDEEV